MFARVGDRYLEQAMKPADPLDKSKELGLLCFMLLETRPTVALPPGGLAFSLQKQVVRPLFQLLPLEFILLKATCHFCQELR
ncbi:hypothetical protein PF005_g16427 [Phytophthora fragariae]|uniref:Uncharacterized protein n=1 Tax=Phytophthora fragariae TaxID=53985 RepID=A0A6A3Y9Q7_9STRA|nr:hypothetical protein PF003_g11900 [Phytophthora fragariae]KAE8932343.1 hypothetical protein PF009_g17624 [Phytophthora fragariae]KAE8990650.1 hypothetical protein PF011_g18264 [Phytophthora fragariae]KAE9097092.1 hypothetical protein PF007_g16745 [Phytophthora fragariae]KAE9102100.1 hypothetical protein PF010_g14230 [Phytophthora fragariae]